jgi:hypothetical protein
MMAPNSASVEGQSTSVSVSLESLQLSMDEECKSYMEEFKVIIISTIYEWSAHCVR